MTATFAAVVIAVLAAGSVRLVDRRADAARRYGGRAVTDVQVPPRTGLKATAFVVMTDESVADARGFVDRLTQALAADDASQGQRYRGVYRRGYNDGADAAFAALHDFLAKGGRVGLPMSPDSLHMVTGGGSTVEVMSLLALRPWTAER